jgi:hypothetical protein
MYIKRDFWRVYHCVFTVFLGMYSAPLYAQHDNVIDLGDGPSSESEAVSSASDDVPAEASDRSTRLPSRLTEPRTLAEQRLHSSAYPEEAELFCSLEQCAFGLSRGLVLGGDVFGMITAPLRRHTDPQWISDSKLYIVDFFGGAQILRNVNSTSNMTVQIGYRRIYFSDDQNDIYSEGFTTRVSFSQKINPYYLQGMEFSGFFVIGEDYLNNYPSLGLQAAGHSQLNDAVSYFYRISQNYPTYRFSLPADVEVGNWSDDQLESNKPLRLYAHFEPFYIQNNVNFSNNLYSIHEQEQDFGVRLAAIAAIESTKSDKPGRYAFRTGLGVDIAGYEWSSKSTGGAVLDLPHRPWLAPYIDLAFSVQF